jgi:hypothetical protein
MQINMEKCFKGVYIDTHVYTIMKLISFITTLNSVDVYR